jgi:3'-phosphoadenosine 5'-phosphosulfate sulfotransferase (PAPS reductase)/FAD synthetase
MTSEQILIDAIEKYKPVRIVLMFSGGHDSLVNSHVCAQILTKLKLDFTVYHGDTTIGIKETQEYVINICSKFHWKLEIRKPPKRQDWYDRLVERFGFPGPTRQSHQICYRRLKERALNHFVTHECKTTPFSRENILLCSGIRKQESKIRMGYVNETTKVASKVWTNPIFYFTEEDIKKYMLKHNLPRNPVKDKICISGECLCGAFAGHEEWTEIKACYPEAAKKIEDLHELAKKNGKLWPWSSGPTKWLKHNPKNQISMFMCVGCDDKNYEE